MRAVPSTVLLSLGIFLFSPDVFGGIDSQALGIVEPLSAVITDVFACGTWTEHGQRGHLRFVLAQVSGGAGTEVYIQRIAETIEGGNQVVRVASTTPILELNNDHSQYLVSAATCVGGSTVQLKAIYEHDEGSVERRIRISPNRTGGYKLTNVLVQASNRGR